MERKSTYEYKRIPETVKIIKGIRDNKALQFVQ